MSNIRSAAFFLVMTLGMSSAQAADRPDIEFHAVIDCSNGLVPQREPQSDLELCVSPQPAFGGPEIRDATAARQPIGEVLGVKLNAAGAMALYRFSSAHVGQKMAILIDGKLVSAPKLMSVISGSAVYISGLTHPQIVRLVERFKALPPI